MLQRTRSRINVIAGDVTHKVTVKWFDRLICWQLVPNYTIEPSKNSVRFPRWITIGRAKLGVGFGRDLWEEVINVRQRKHTSV
jgi:hypothetical protein